MFDHILQLLTPQQTILDVDIRLTTPCLVLVVDFLLPNSRVFRLVLNFFGFSMRHLTLVSSLHVSHYDRRLSTLILNPSNSGATATVAPGYQQCGATYTQFRVLFLAFGKSFPLALMYTRGLIAPRRPMFTQTNTSSHMAGNWYFEGKSSILQSSLNFRVTDQ